MKKRILLSMILVTALVLNCFVTTIVSNAKTSELEEYKQVLNELNKEWGTNYEMPSEAMLKSDGHSYDEMVLFYKSMTIEEFKVYLKKVYANDNKSQALNKSNITLENAGKSIGEIVSPMATTKTQKYYYDASDTNNYLYIKSTIYHADGKDRYSSVNSSGYHMGSFPQYRVKSFSKSYNTGHTKVYCTFICYRYLSEYLVNAATISVNVTFTASGGNEYPIA